LPESSALITVLWAVPRIHPGAYFNEMDAHGAGSLLVLLVNGPALGGLWLFFLKRIRPQSHRRDGLLRLSHRFLLSALLFRVCVLIALGFICCVLPFFISWWRGFFTLPLVH